jgi:hypothetical protein
MDYRLVHKNSAGVVQTTGTTHSAIIQEPSTLEFTATEIFSLSQNDYVEPQFKLYSNTYDITMNFLGLTAQSINMVQQASNGAVIPFYTTAFYDSNVSTTFTNMSLANTTQQYYICPTDLTFTKFSVGQQTETVPVEYEYQLFKNDSIVDLDGNGQTTGNFTLTGNLANYETFSADFLIQNALAYYPFNGNVNDASGNGNDATLYGSGNTYTTGKYGDQALVINSSGTSYLLTPTMSNIQSILVWTYNLYVRYYIYQWFLWRCQLEYVLY